MALRARPLERTPGPKIQQPSPKAPSPHFSPLRLPQVERVLRPRPPLHRQVKPHDAVLVPPAHHPRTAPRSPSKSSCSLLACRSARCVPFLPATTALMTAMASSFLPSRHDSPWPLPPSAAPPDPRPQPRSRRSALARWRMVPSHSVTQSLSHSTAPNAAAWL